MRLPNAGLQRFVSILQTPVSRGRCLRSAVRDASSDIQTDGQLAVLWPLCSNSKSTTGAQSTVPLQNNVIIPSSTFVSTFSTLELNRALSCLLCEPRRHYVTVCTYLGGGGLGKLIYLFPQQGLWGPSAVGVT
jgi:hypothetical protein